MIVNLLMAFILALIPLIGLTGLFAWRRAEKILANRILFLALGVTTALLVVGLSGQGFQRAHIPPTTLDELLAVLMTLILVLGLVIGRQTRTAAGVLSLGLLLSLPLVGWGLYAMFIGPTLIGLEPLWVWALPGRWLILASLAGFYWLTVMAVCSWGQAAPNNPWLKPLQPELIALADSQRWLGLLVTLSLLIGAPILILRGWWGGGDASKQTLGLAVFLLLLAAGWWLRTARPQQSRTGWLLTILTFIVALPVLQIIAV